LQVIVYPSFKVVSRCHDSARSSNQST
jgi:hypothetical protein